MKTYALRALFLAAILGSTGCTTHKAGGLSDMDQYTQALQKTKPTNERKKQNTQRTQDNGGNEKGIYTNQIDL